MGDWVDPPEVPDHRDWTPSSRGDEGSRRERSVGGRRPGAARRAGGPVRRPGRGATVGVVLVSLGVLQTVLDDPVVVSRMSGTPPETTVLARYDAAEGVLGRLRDGTDDGRRADALWDEWVRLMPPQWARRVEVFELSTDGTGPGSFAAYVSPVDDRGRRWRLAVDPDDAAANLHYYQRVLVHELAHILTLSDVVAGPTHDSLLDARRACGPAGFTGGCVESDSLLGRFTATFWSDEDDLAAADHLRGLRGAAYEQAVLERYRTAASRFVTPYSATDPEEDLAETIVAAAFGDPQRSTSVAAEKVEMVRTDPEVFSFVLSVGERLRR